MYVQADLHKEELSAQLEILQCNFAVEGKSPDEVMINDLLTYLSFAKLEERFMPNRHCIFFTFCSTCHKCYKRKILLYYEKN